MGKEYPSYYSILTAPVRYDENLKPSEKILFSEITALCNKNGHCWASNSYFAKLYKVTKQTVSSWISSLEKSNYIRTELDKEAGNQRKLYINESLIAINEKNNSPIQKKINHNTTSTNNKSNKDNMSKSIPHIKIKNLYNSICTSLQPIKILSDKRKEKIKTRWKELSKLCEEGQTELDLFKTIFEKVEASDFLTNRMRNNKARYENFKVDFNWLIENNDNYVKVLECKYDNKDKSPSYDKQSAEERRNKILEAQKQRFKKDG